MAEELNQPEEDQPIASNEWGPPEAAINYDQGVADDTVDQSAPEKPEDPGWFIRAQVAVGRTLRDIREGRADRAAAREQLDKAIGGGILSRADIEIHNDHKHRPRSQQQEEYWDELPEDKADALRAFDATSALSRLRAIRGLDKPTRAQAIAADRQYRSAHINDRYVTPTEAAPTEDEDQNAKHEATERLRHEIEQSMHDHGFSRNDQDDWVKKTRKPQQPTPEQDDATGYDDEDYDTDEDTR